MRSTPVPSPVRLGASHADWAFAVADGTRYRTAADGAVTVQPQHVRELVRRGFTILPTAPPTAPAARSSRNRKAR